LSLDSLFRGKAYANNHQVEQNPIITQKIALKISVRKYSAYSRDKAWDISKLLC
jgi:hypothetical protein